MRRLTFRHVEMIYSVVLTGSVTGAAMRMHITQPAISNLIRETEERLGFALFERFPGRLVPTPRALLIYREIERSFIGLEAINDLCAGLQTQVRRKILIASGPAFAASVLPRVISAYRSEVEDVHFSVVSCNAEQVQGLVSTQKVDFGFALNTPSCPGVLKVHLASMRLECLLPANHPLRDRNVIHAADLLYEPMITQSRVEGFDDIVLTAFSGFPAPPPSVVECPAAITAGAMVEAGVGFTLLDPIHSYLHRHSALVSRHRFEPALYVELCAYYAPSRSTDTTGERLIELARRHCEDFTAVETPCDASSAYD